MIQPGQVVRLYSEQAGKTKYHLCVSLKGGFLFLNSPKVRKYAGDLEVPCSEFPFIEATPSGVSIISCSMVVPIRDAELRRRRAQVIGSCSAAILRQIIAFVEDAEFLTEEDRDHILDGLGDWI